jgi:hypothetical protein
MKGVQCRIVRRTDAQAVASLGLSSARLGTTTKGAILLRESSKAALLLNLAATECRPAGPSAGQKCKWIIDLQRWSAKGLADLL